MSGRSFNIRNGFLTVKLRLTLWYVLILTVVLVGFSTLLVWNLRQSMYRQADALLKAQAAQLLAEVEAENGRIRLPEIQEITATGTLAAFYDTSGRKVDGAWLKDLLPAQITPTIGCFIQKEKSGDWLVSTSRVQEGEEVLGWLRLVRSLETEERTRERLITILLLAVPLTILGASGGGYFLARKALSPIDAITNTARTISRGNLSERVGGPGTNDELGRLAATFDEMLDQLERNFKRQQQFTADASHELRTPIAIIRAQAEEALSKNHSVEEYKDALEVIHQQAERMSRLVRQLLFLARSDSGQEVLQKETVDVSQLVEIVAEEMGQMAASKGVELTTVLCGKPLELYGDQSKLVQLLVNLVDNAIKYTPTGGRVTISARQKENALELQVTDTGIGIPKEHQEHVFERFYRVDKARSSDTGGTGLGLAICRWIAEAHGGSINVDSEPGRGTTFTVHLPYRRV
ncbi:MAG TPA: HAMP domain-containing protein [Clostridia bacterium]|nr:HAMP domain-containing protein [Clostridia bacterium]